MKKGNELFKKLNIRIAFAFLILSLSVISILSIFVYNFTSDILKKDDVKKTENAIIQASDFISGYINKLKSFSEIIALHTDIQNALIEGEASSLDSIYSLILLAKESDSHIKSISVVSKNGLVISSGNNMAVPITGDMLSQDWYQSALASSAMPILASTGHGVFEMDDNDWIVSICREIKTEDNSHLGIVIIDVSYKFIEDYIASLDLGSKGYIYILSKSNALIYHPNKEFLSQEMSKELVANRNHGMDGSLYRADIENTDWMMYGSSSFDNLNVLKLNLLRVLIVSILITIALSIVFSGVMSNYLSRPIIDLTKKMMQADQTWAHIPVDKRASLEVASLGKEYNNLIDRIKILTENIAKKEEDRRLFELRALQSQINPHFLYNTLDTILWLAELEQHKEVVNVSFALGKMLRISLSNEQAFILLERELEHSLSYLNIQKVRYEDMLTFSIFGDERLLNLYVPKLIVQPIVENSIYHGIRGKKAKGNIRIEYRKEEDILVITIVDDGVGFDETKPKSTKRQRNKSGGIGMDNVRSRIKILCGEEFGLDVTSGLGEGTRVELRLPIKEQI